MSKKSSRRIPAKRNPLLLGESPLNFDGIPEEELLELTDDQEMAAFLSKWQRSVHPFSAYPRVFVKGEKSCDRIFREIKIYFKQKVIHGDWSEKKYVMVINSIFEGRATLNLFTLERFGKMYDSQRLPVQIRLKREGS